ncbi:MAG: alpha-hydroxy-acid oxidizing protein [Actinobacteria bacterium]|nr:alpha-hydroxy-acid oxidizing protein [Actinomycetota bacterium]
MTTRRIPRWGDFSHLVGFTSGSCLDHCASIADVRRLARRRVPRAVFDYTDGAAGDELSLRRTRAVFARVEFQPRVLRDVSIVDTSTTLLGGWAALPVVLGPTGFTRLMHHSGEPAVAAVAGRSGIPYGLSTLGTTSIEDLARDAPDTRRWFQLYLMRDRGYVKELVQRASDCGYDTIILTVDTPVAGRRHRDVRNGLTIPPRITPRTAVDMALHPRWWGNLLTTEPITFATLSSTDGTVADLIGRVFDPTINIGDLDWLRGVWGRQLAVKGVQGVDDAVMVADHGADAVILSNHGGRQLERAPVPLEILPAVRQAVDPRVEVLIDGGVMSGADVVAALALGASAVAVGRAYLYGLMAGGERGVQRVVDLLREEIESTMRLLGRTSIDQLDPDCVRMRATS